jgi:hypothetical protein
MERKPVLTFSAAVGPVQGNGVAVFMLDTLQWEKVGKELQDGLVATSVLPN